MKARKITKTQKKKIQDAFNKPANQLVEVNTCKCCYCVNNKGYGWR